MPLHAKDKKHAPALPSEVRFLACIAKAPRKAASWQLPPDCCEALAPRAANRFCQAIDMSHRRHARRGSTIPQSPTICRNSHRPEFPLPSVVSRKRLRLAPVKSRGQCKVCGVTTVFDSLVLNRFSVRPRRLSSAAFHARLDCIRYARYAHT